MPSMILQHKQYQNILYRVEEKNAELVWTRYYILQLWNYI